MKRSSNLLQVLRCIEKKIRKAYYNYLSIFFVFLSVLFRPNVNAVVMNFIQVLYSESGCIVHRTEAYLLKTITKAGTGVFAQF